MSRLDELPPDQRAALSLLVRQRKSYADVASTLGIAERSVHDRAHAALGMLAPREAREVPAEQRLEIGDYLLGQQSIADRLKTRTYLSSSEPARAWAQALSSELAALAGAALPEIPAAEPTSANAGEGAEGQPTAADRGEPISAYAAAPSSAAGGPRQSSRLGGALLLAAILAAVVVAVVVLSGGGGSHKKAQTTSTTASTGPTVSARIPMRSPSRNSRSLGLVEILTEGSKRAFYVVAEGLPATKGFFYALWLRNSATSHEPLGKAPPVGTNRKLEGGGALPPNAGEFKEILLTRETNIHAGAPGSVVLRGTFTLGG